MTTAEWNLVMNGIVALGALGWIADRIISNWKNRQPQRFRNLEGDISQALAAVDNAQKILREKDSLGGVRAFFQDDISPVFSKLKELNVRPKVEEPFWIADSDSERNAFMVTQWFVILKTMQQFSREGNLKKAREFTAPKLEDFIDKSNQAS